MSNFWPPYLAELKGEVFYDCLQITYPLPRVAGALGDVVEDAVFENSWGYRSILIVRTCQKYRTSDRFTPWYLAVSSNIVVTIR